MRDCEKSVKAAEKEASKKKDDDDFMGGEDSGGSSGMLDLRGGLSVSLTDAQVRGCEWSDGVESSY
jgi:hypothetical protein